MPLPPPAIGQQQQSQTGWQPVWGSFVRSFKLAAGRLDERRQPLTTVHPSVRRLFRRRLLIAAHLASFVFQAAAAAAAAADGRQ